MNMKPRAYDRKNRYMFYFSDLNTDDEYGYLIFSPINEIRDRRNRLTERIFFASNIDDYDITWSIGRQDKNGKEIYQGDIIKWATEGYMMSSSYISSNIGCMAEDEVEIVVIGDDLTHVPNFKKYTMMGSIERKSTIEIIGNKFEKEKVLYVKQN